MTALEILLLAPVVISVTFFCGALMIFAAVAFVEMKRPTKSGDE